MPTGSGPGRGQFASLCAAGSGQGTFGDVVMPAEIAGDSAAGGSTFGGTNRAFASRVVIPKTGTLRDLAVYVVTSNGNVDVGVYNTASPRARLYSSGSVACPSAGAWQVIGDADLPVTKGESYDFLLGSSGSTASFWRYQTGTQALLKLPSGFAPGDGGTCWIAYSLTSAFPLPSSIAEVDFNATSAIFLIIGRIV